MLYDDATNGNKDRRKKAALSVLFPAQPTPKVRFEMHQFESPDNLEIELFVFISMSSLSCFSTLD